MAKEEISNKTVFVLAVLVVLVVASSTWLVLNKLNSMGATAIPQQPLVEDQEINQAQIVGGGRVSISIQPTEVNSDEDVQ